MAENFIKGVDGKIYLAGGLQARINNWTINMAAPTEDVTDFGSAGQEHEYTGLANFSGSITGQMLRGDGAPVQRVEAIMKTFSSTGTLAKSSARFVEHAQSMWYGTVLFTNFSKNAPAEGLQTFSGDWVSDGRLKWKNSTTP